MWKYIWKLKINRNSKAMILTQQKNYQMSFTQHVQFLLKVISIVPEYQKLLTKDYWNKNVCRTFKKFKFPPNKLTLFLSLVQ